MRRKSFSLVLVLAFCVSFLMPGLFFSSQAGADTPAGWYQQDAGTTGPLKCVSALDGETIWVGGYLPSSSTSSQALFLRSVDGGSNWTQSLYPTTPPVDTVVAVDGISGVDADTAWAGGASAQILGHTGGLLFGTTDGGTSWNIQDSGFRGSIKSISTVDAQTSYAAGDTYPDFPFIMKTTDGANWSLAYGEATYSSPLYGIFAVDSNTVWAVGTGGMILKTTDGTNWAHQDFPTSNNLKGVSAIDSTNAWAVGDSGVILHTTDGTSWSIQDSGVTTDLNSVSAVSTSTAWAVGAGGTLIKTVDGGATWTPQESGVTTNLNGVSAVDPNTAWAVGDGGVVLHTTDGGTEAPTVTSISPGTGVAGWIVKVTNLAGTGFQAGATVKLSMSGQGDIAATGVNVQSDQEITCDFDLTGAAAGAWDVVVTNPDAQEGRLAGGFTVNNPAPTTSGLSPSSETAGQPGFPLTVNGTGFITSSTVNWNGAAKSTTYVSDTQLTAAIPASDIASAGTASVTVFNPAPGGGTSDSQTFTINPAPVNNPVPTITCICPISKIAGQPGFPLTVNGTGFITSSTVNWNGAARSTSYVSATKLTASIPASDIASAGTASVTVTNPAPGGGTSNAQTVTVNNPKPITTFISPKWKIAGQSAFTLTVNGRNFVAGSVVKWNGANMTTTYVSPNELTAAIPASNISTSGRPCWARWLPEFAYVTVFNPTPGGGTSNARWFWVLPSFYW